ncbi:unnamed protein product, partial [Cyprideis torosa]
SAPDPSYWSPVPKQNSAKEEEAKDVFLARPNRRIAELSFILAAPLLTRRIGHPYRNRTPPKRKKPRTSFSRVQIAELQKRFHKQKYLATAERATLAKALKMTDAQVKTWFQNRRTKWRRQTAEERGRAATCYLMSLQAISNSKSMLADSREPTRLSTSPVVPIQPWTTSAPRSPPTAPAPSLLPIGDRPLQATPPPSLPLVSRAEPPLT